MKFVIFAVSITTIFAMHADINSNKALYEVIPANATQEYLLLDPVWYSFTPVIYDYTPVIYSYWDYWYYPSYWVSYRKENTASSEKKKFNKEEAAKELSLLKKEIWGKESFNTDEIKRSQKVYDPRWLMAQLKIARALNLEDMMKNKEEQKKNLKSKVPNSNTLDSRNEFSVPIKNYNSTLNRRFESDEIKEMSDSEESERTEVVIEDTKKDTKKGEKKNSKVTSPKRDDAEENERYEGEKEDAPKTKKKEEKKNSKVTSPKRDEAEY